MATPPLDRPPPSTLAVAFATAILAGLTGFFIGQASSIGLFSKPSAPNEKASVESDLEPSESESEGAEEDDEEGAQQELASFDNIDEECKLVLVVRTDLGMTKGTSSQHPSAHTEPITDSTTQAKSPPNAATQP